MILQRSVSRRRASRPSITPHGLRHCFRNAYAQHRSRSALDPGDARPCEPGDDAALYSCQRESFERGLSPCPSTSLSRGIEPGANSARTTILSVRHAGHVVIAGDGQVSVGQTIMKSGATKVRRLHQDRGAGGLRGLDRRRADAVRQVRRQAAGVQWQCCAAPRSSWPRTGAPIACCAGSRRCWSWRTRESSLLISGVGDVIEPDDGILAIGSGGNYALAAARALVRHCSGDERARRSRRGAMKIASEICVYTNDEFVFEEL